LPSIKEVNFHGGNDLTTFKLLDHESVPHHEIIGEDEVAKLLAKYAIDKEQLPKIRDDDPIVNEIGAKKGDIIKITRKSQTADESIYYRLVIDAIS
jgi:DNA-directed RNA polymerase subunit H